MRDGVNDRIRNRLTFRDQSWQNGDERCDLILISVDSLKANNDVWRPHDYPKRNVKHRHFSDAHFGTLSILIGVDRKEVTFNFLACSRKAFS